ncbi:MAG: helix-turn-helix transcriptional regulator [Oscillospiraceae bacterium]|nr:helix-turn-helix transcriptional regulator [Oscillospiraceae bacterium]
MNIGDKIRALRTRDGRTQETIAAALGVSAQAVSRWESGGGYPDIEIVPAIANYFGVTLDELFGYESERDARIDEIVAAAEDKRLRHHPLTEILPPLREAIAEFPANEKLLLCLATALYRAPRDVAGEQVREAAKVFEYLHSSSHDVATVRQCERSLSYIYGELGENERACKLAESFDPLGGCREVALANASRGDERVRSNGKLLLEIASQICTAIPRQLVMREDYFAPDTDIAIRKVRGAIAFMELIIDDGNFGYYHADLADLNEWLSHLHFRRGESDEGFACLDRALYHITEFVKLARTGVHRYTAPLCDLVEVDTDTWDGMDAALDEFPSGWPMWVYPPVTDETWSAITADPRWTEWLTRWRTARDAVRELKGSTRAPNYTPPNTVSGAE